MGLDPLVVVREGRDAPSVFVSNQVVPGVSRTPLEAAADLLSQRRPAEALRCLDDMPAAAAPSPEATKGNLLRAEAFWGLGRPEQAIPLLEDVCRAPEGWTTSGDLRAAHHLQGVCLRASGRFLEAAEAFLDALTADPCDLASLHALQFTRLDDDAIATLFPRLEGLAAHNPNNALAQQILAEWEYRCGRVESALIRSHRAARWSTRRSQRPLLDHGALPTVPDALIIGAPKCGTTSLLGWLSLHQRLWAHPRKELHFFDTHWERGRSWYACQFPVFRQGSGILRIEATPNYFQLYECPERVQHLHPEMRLILLLREPVARALSWCHHMLRQEGLEGDPVEILETERRDLESLALSERDQLGWRHPNCLAGSLYGPALARWRDRFSTDQLLVLCLEDLASDPLGSLDRVLGFLGLPTFAPPQTALQVSNSAPAPYPDLPETLRQRLVEGLLADSLSLWRHYLQGQAATDD